MQHTAKATDAQLVQQYLNGHEQSLTHLMDLHGDQLLHFIFKKVRDWDLSQDIAQDAWIKFIHAVKLGKYVESGRFMPWMYRVAGNLAMDHFRKMKRSPVVSVEQCHQAVLSMGDEQFNAEEVMLSMQFNESMWEAVSKLPSNQQEVVKLRVQSNLSFRAIAEETGVGINTALGRMRYAVINLRKELQLKG